MTGKVTVGLSSYWGCVTDFRGLSTYSLQAHGLRQADERPTDALRGMWHLTRLKSQMKTLSGDWILLGR